jgi:hypothetical protein
VEEAFIDSSFAPAKKGVQRSGKRNAARERRSWRWQIAMVFPSLICVESATPHEVKLVVPTLVQMVIPESPRNLIGDGLGQTRR